MNISEDQPKTFPPVMDTFNPQPFFDRYAVLGKSQDEAQKVYDEGTFQLTVDVLQAKFPELNVRVKGEGEDRSIAWDGNTDQAEELTEFLYEFRDLCFATV